MSIILVPLAPPGIASIPVSDGLLGIGRESGPFKDLDISSGLSIRHAYIFRERNRFHLMAIEGETTHNGHPLPPKQPAELAPGDEIGFARALYFRIMPGTADLALPTLRVTLTPGQDSVNSETIVLECLPFLVSRKTVLFREYETTMPAAIRALSRRHAFLYARGGELYLRDLGSTNGTWIGDKRLEPHAEVPVYSGETLAFGSPLLSYTVQLERLDTEAPTRTVETYRYGTDEPNSGMQRIGKTVYIHTADSFLDIFLDSSPDEMPVQENGNGPDAPERTRMPVSRLRAISQGLREALTDEHPRSRRRPMLWAAGGALVLAIGGGYFLYDTPQRQITELLEREQYRAAFLQAGDHREHRPEDAAIEALATEALSRWLVPTWLQALRQEDYEQADALLADALSSGSLYPESKQLLSLLGWVNELEYFTARRGGSNGPLVLFRDEQTINGLLERWETEASDFELLLVKLAEQIPEFREQRTQVLSRLRALRNEQTVYLSALEELRNDLNQQLASGNTDAVMLQLAHFERRYPRIAGLSALRQDIVQMERLRKALTTGDMDALLATQDVTFETPWVREIAQNTLVPQMPEPAILDQYRQALTVWQAGNAEQAITLLRELSGQEEGVRIASTLRHFERVAEFMRSLSDARRREDYGEHLLAFARTLDRERDRHFLATLEEELSQHEKILETELDRLLTVAREEWNAYREAGGISSLMRLEDTVSEAFRTQSQRLLGAYQALDEILQGYGLLDRTPPDNTRQLQQAVLREVRLQRQSFTDLGLVMEPALLRDKLQLLPQPEES
ncbi:MAG: FHA domain-containing protein [Candidatus Competibacterales bacterium]|nr:FHA domain-containing protein [Candidatus Competibacterales bacterium]